jgi:uncharacterized protein (TIGR03083 family)
MDYVGWFGREAGSFEIAARTAAQRESAPAVPSCPGWTMTDLILHLGTAQRVVSHLIDRRIQQPPRPAELTAWVNLPDEWAAWLPPNRAPRGDAVPPVLLDWFRKGAADLEERLLLTDPDEPVWSWSGDYTAGFWQRMQAIEAAVYRWDAQKALAMAEPLDSALATDAIAQHFEVMAPMRRATAQAAPGQGERFLFRRTDGPQSWPVRFDSETIQLGSDGDRDYDIEIAGRASDLALFLWHRPVNNQLDILGDTRMLKRYFDLVPPLEKIPAGAEYESGGRRPGAFG